MQVKLPDGFYPFIDQRFPLSELVMIEVPHDLEQLLRSQTTANGMSIIQSSGACRWSFDAGRSSFRMLLFLSTGRMRKIACTCLRRGSSQRAKPEPCRPRAKEPVKCDLNFQNKTRTFIVCKEE
ncbi:hypothetical protein NKJ72_19985 [Mesorhizobium sp. M0045]|uniref:hypothetical protein n=1 Tax=Mesorhizobium sp. M0045 TaxID=2956857 RepID=UPI0033377EC6